MRCVSLLRMGTKEKLIGRFKRQPKDFTWEELVRLFSLLGFEMGNKGKTSGSRVIFVKGENTYTAHKPHPGSIVKSYVIKQVLDYLNGLELLK